MNSEDYIYHCVDIMNADKNLSDETKILMFVEYGRKLLKEKEQENGNGWLKYPENRPTSYGRYEVFRAGCNKQHYETWNNTGWAYNNNDITHYRFIVNPSNFKQTET